MIHKFQLIDRVFMTVTEKGSTLTIRSAKKEDSGQYMCQVPNGQLDPQKLIHTVSNHGLDEEDRKLKKTSDSISLLLKLRPSQTHHQHHQIANNNRYPKNTIYKNIIANAAMTNFVSVITIYNFDPSHTLFCPIFKSKWYFRLNSYLLGPLALLQTESRFGFFIIKLK